MKIVHIAPNAPFNDDWGYQENLLPKYQVKLGHQVWILLRNITHEDSRIVECDCGEYVSNDGVTVKRFPRREYPHRLLSILFSYIDVYDTLCSIRPDFIFFHGLQSYSIVDAVRYKKECNPECVIVQDNHLDNNIGFKGAKWKWYITRTFYRFLNSFSQKYVERVYGVTPWRKRYAEDFFKISPQKTDVLIMGADDEKINFAQREKIRNRIREQYGIQDGDFFIVSGGKIDSKKNIHMLAQAVRGMSNVKLLIFGNVSEAFREEFAQSLNEQVQYIGWIKADAVYDYFFAADLVFFPGQHSVLWEQACAAKVPTVFKRWEGMEHVNNGGNAAFVDDISVESLQATISQLHFTDAYQKMKHVAESENTDIYLYSHIAEKSLECITPST